MVRSSSVVTEYRTAIQRWVIESHQSIKRNLHGCKFLVANSTFQKSHPTKLSRSFQKGQHVRQKTELNNATVTFIAEIIVPNYHEYHELQQIPSTLTKVHRDVATAASLRGYNYQQWGNQQDSRWEIPSNHPGQNRKNCLNMTELAAKDGKIYAFYDVFKQIDRGFYLLKTWNGLVHPGGSVMTECGYYQGEEGCENRWNHAEGWTNKCKSELKKMNISWIDLFKKEQSQLKILLENCSDLSDLGIPFSSSSSRWNITIVPKVLVISALWDYNYHHFLVDSLARLASVYQFILNHSDIYLHIRNFEDYDRLYQKNKEFQKEAKILRSQFFQLLGIRSERIVSGAVLAKEIWIPRSMRCSYAVSNPIEIRRLRDILWQRALQHIRTTSFTVFELVSQRNMFGIHHSKGNMPALSEFPIDFLSKTSLYWPNAIPKQFIQSQQTKTGHQYILIYQRYFPWNTDRYWNDDQFSSIILSFHQAFPDHIILPFSSSHLFRSNYCLACDLILYSLPDVFVAAHGAGLTNMMFMPTNSLIVEIAGEFKDVNMPVCGYYGPFSAIFGHHHYLYAFSHEQNWKLQSQSAADEASAFHNFLWSGQGENEPSRKEIIISVANSTGEYFPYRP